MRLLTFMFALLATPLWAHPHVFVDVGIEVVLDDKTRVTHVRVTWAYDDFYSLLIAEDRDMDKDGDGALTQEEEARLNGFDANWVPGYEGDVYLTIDEQPLVMSGPMKATATMVDGRIVSSHLREVTGTPALSTDTLVVKAYDPSYYTAYELTLPIKVTGHEGCSIVRHDPDNQAELAKMQAFLMTLSAETNLEENDIPMLGENFASELRVSCPGS